MSITTVPAPDAANIDGVSSGTNATGTKTVTKSGSYYYRSFLLVTGNSVAVLSTNHGLQSSNFTYSYSPTDTQLLTSLANASALTWYVQVREYANITAYTDGSPYTSLNSATSTITISVRHSVSGVDAYDAVNGGNMTARWSEPSTTHTGWRARVEFWLADSSDNRYPVGQPTLLQTGSGYSSTSGTVTTASATLAEIRNMSIALPGLKLCALVFTGWQLTGGATYFSGAAGTVYNTITAWTVPAIETGTLTSERYDKIRYYDGAAWQKPSQVKVWDGSQWVDYGTAGSYNTNQIKSWYNSQWTTFTKQGSESYTYNTTAQGLTKNPSLIDDPYLIYTYSTTTVEVNRMAAEDGGFGAYASHLISTANNYGWAGTTVGNDGLNEIISLYWAQDGPRWINRLRFRTANTTYYRAAPRIIDVKFLRADGTWVLGDGTTTTDGTTWTTENTHYTKYSIATGTYTAALTYGGYFTINAQHPQGFVGIRMRVINDTTYKEITQSTRTSGIDVDFGTITLTNTWT